jgi:hypothetical protein
MRFSFSAPENHFVNDKEKLMAVYLYNLMFSLTGSNVNVGSFELYPAQLPPSPNIGNVSSAWFAANSMPPGLPAYFQVMTQPLTSSLWASPQSDANDLTLNPGDYLVMRIFSQDSNASNYQVRVTGVFGRGTSTALGAGGGNLQSPLVMSTASTPNNTLPRAVIDVDTSLATSWPAPLSDGSWVAGLGQIVVAPGGLPNDYTLNVGASVYVKANPPAAGNLFTFGRDPRMHVTGTAKTNIAA